MYSAKMFRDNTQGTVDFFANYIYYQPALQPAFHWLAANTSSTSLPQPKIKFTPDQRRTINLDKTTESSNLIKQIAIYKLKGNGWVLFKVLSTVETNEIDLNVGVELEKGYYAAVFVDRFNREGMKSHFEV